MPNGSRSRSALRYRAIQAERAGTKRRYGACFEDGTIKIRLINVVSGEPLRYESLMDTLCHELAHLKYWHHGPGFQRFHRRLLAYAREQRLYEPGGAEPGAGSRPSRSGRPAGVRPAPVEAPWPERTRRSAPTAARETGRKPEQLSLFLSWTGPLRGPRSPG